MIKFHSNSFGFTLFEIIIAIFLISIAVIPMMKSFRPAMMSSKNVEKSVVMANQARGTMERLLLLDFDTLSSKTDEVQPLSGNDVFGDVEETITFESDSYSPEITISDASGDASKTLLTLTVSLADITFSTLKADY